MANQQFKDYITTRTEDTAPDIAADFLPIYDASATTTKKVTPTSLRTRMFASGSIDGGGLTSFEIPNSAAPTVDADGEIAVDTSVTDFSHGLMRMFAGEEQFVISVPVAALASPTNGHVIKYNATNDEFELGAAAGGIGGSTGSTDNAILRADGTGGSTLQSSSATIDDSGNIRGASVGSSSGIFEFYVAGFKIGEWKTSGILGVQYGVGWGSTPGATIDVMLERAAAGVLGLTNDTSGGISMQLQEMTAPSAGGATSCRIYAEDNGSGKTRLMALFGSGAAQQLAIEP